MEKAQEVGCVHCLPLLCLAVVNIPPLYQVIRTLQLTTLLHLSVMVIHVAGDDVAGSMNAHIPQ